MKRSTRMAVGSCLVFTLACVGGASLDENTAGGDGWLDHEPAPDKEAPEDANDDLCAWTGHPYVSVTTERAYTLLYEIGKDCHELTTDDPTERKTVWGLRPGDAHAELMIDVTGHEDVRLLDTAPGLLLMGEVEGVETLYRIDHDTLELLEQRETESFYWGTRTSPSRRWVAVGDNAPADRLPIHVIDPATLETTEIDPGGWWAEAMWTAEREALAAILFEEDLSEARLVLWDFAGADGLPTLGGGSGTSTMPEPTFDVVVPDVSPIIGAGFTWIGIDPLDRQVVFPVEKPTGYGALLVLDLLDGTVGEVGAARGPVAYTPDGSTIVAWSHISDSELVLVDPVTLERTSVPVPIDGIPEFFVSHDGSDVLVADVFGREELVILDLETGEQVVLETSMPITDFSSRIGHDELWMTNDGLWRIDLADAVVEEIDLDWRPENVVWMPESDLLLLDDAIRPRMIFFDPDARTVVQDVELDPTLRAAPRLSLARRLGR